MLLHRCLDDRGLGLLRGRARKVLLGPYQPAPHLLVLRELLIGASHNRLRIRNGARVWRFTLSRGGIGGVAQHEHRTRLGVATLLQTNDDAVADFGLLAQRRFQVFGINVHAFASDDDILLATLEVEIAFGVELADIAGAKPAFSRRAPASVAFPANSRRRR